MKNTIKEYMKISHVTSSNQRAKTLICYTFHKMTKQEGGLGKCDMGAKPHIRWSETRRPELCSTDLYQNGLFFVFSCDFEMGHVTNCYEHIRHNRGYDTVFARASLNGFWGNVRIQVFVTEETWMITIKLIFVYEQSNYVHMCNKGNHTHKCRMSLG